MINSGNFLQINLNTHMIIISSSTSDSKTFYMLFFAHLQEIANHLSTIDSKKYQDCKM